MAASSVNKDAFGQRSKEAILPTVVRIIWI